MRSFFLLFLVMFAPLCADPTAPEPSTGFVKKQMASGKKMMATTANAYATETALSIIREGGNAIDAALAAQIVLNVVEPQSSGIGGGAFLLYYKKNEGKVYVYDGRDVAPALVDEKYFLDERGIPIDEHFSGLGGKPVGVPGLLRMFEMAHKEHGKLAWRRLFQRGIDLAESGFPLSHRLETLINSNLFDLSHFASADDLFFAGKKSALPIVRNPVLASTLTTIAIEGPDAFYTGPIAEKIVEKIGKALINPGVMTQGDLANYKPIRREPLSFDYKNYRIVSLPPPSSGGIALAQILGMLEAKNCKIDDLGNLDFINTFLQASQLAFADRNYFVADPDFFDVPTKDLINKEYLAKRSALIKPKGTLGSISEGEFPKRNLKVELQMPKFSLSYNGTTHFCIVDLQGNAVAVSSTLGRGFGSKLNVEGFFLNSILSDFCCDEPPRKAAFANVPVGGKRPLSSMAPVMVFDKSGALVMVAGSAGGQPIIDYVAEALLGVLDAGLNVQDAISFPHFFAADKTIEIERGTPLEKLLQPLKSLGHTSVKIKALTSGTHAIVANPAGGWFGSADPRREGLALGE